MGGAPEVMRKYDITLSAGAQVRMPISGENFYVRSTTGAVDVWSDDRNIDMQALLAGEGSDGKHFDALSFANNTASTITLVVVTSEENFRSNRVQIVGSVNKSTSITSGSGTYDTNPTSINPISDQIRIRFRCAVANTGTITVAGITYAAGETDSIETSAAVSVVASAAGQVLEYSQEAAS